MLAANPTRFILKLPVLVCRALASVSASVIALMWSGIILSTEKAMSVLKAIHEAGMRAAVAISPDTPSLAISDELGQAADMLLVMTVHPGRGGQKFIENCVVKVRHWPDFDRPGSMLKLGLPCKGIGITCPFPKQRHPSRWWCEP